MFASSDPIIKTRTDTEASQDHGSNQETTDPVSNVQNCAILSNMSENDDLVPVSQAKDGFEVFLKARKDLVAISQNRGELGKYDQVSISQEGDNLLQEKDDHVSISQDKDDEVFISQDKDDLASISQEKDDQISISQEKDDLVSNSLEREKEEDMFAESQPTFDQGNQV